MSVPLMKKLGLILVCLLAAICGARAQSITFEINAGLLENSTGTAVEPNGGLLQLIASPSGTFSAPTSTSYVTGDNVLVSSFAMNSNSGTAGLTVNDFTNLALSNSSYTLTSGEALLLRFYPNLTLAAEPGAPTLATTYGQVRSSTAESGITDGSQTAWVVPAGGSTVDLDYVTASARAGATYSNISAYATNTVLVGSVPEPSTWGTLGGTLMSFMCLRAWKRRSSSVAA